MLGRTSTSRILSGISAFRDASLEAISFAHSTFSVKEKVLKSGPANFSANFSRLATLEPPKFL